MRNEIQKNEENKHVLLIILLLNRNTLTQPNNKNEFLKN